MQRQDDDMAHVLPGMLVRCPQRPEWGLGQVQSSIPGRITVTFEHAGKLALDTARVVLEPVIDTDPPSV